MNTTPPRLFFPLLARRSNYSCKPNGQHYVYSYYRTEIAEDCEHRCVYCDAKADEVGGAEAMQLEHFRPQSFEEFSHLTNDPRNLNYACGRCNLWKSNWWPAFGSDSTHNGSEGFLDPFSEDRLEYFSFSGNGEIHALKPPAAYIIRLLRLEREYLRKLRELRILKDLWCRKIRDLRKKAEAGELPKSEELAKTLAAIEALLQ
jgi:hypothetical protein